MTPERCKELLPVIQAYADGKTVQARCRTGGNWRDVAEPNWVDENQYRTKPEKPRFWDVSLYRDGSITSSGQPIGSARLVRVVESEPVHDLVIAARQALENMPQNTKTLQLKYELEKWEP